MRFGRGVDPVAARVDAGAAGVGDRFAASHEQRDEVRERAAGRKGGLTTGEARDRHHPIGQQVLDQHLRAGDLVGVHRVVGEACEHVRDRRRGLTSAEELVPETSAGRRRRRQQHALEVVEDRVEGASVVRQVQPERCSGRGGLERLADRIAAVRCHEARRDRDHARERCDHRLRLTTRLGHPRTSPPLRACRTAVAMRCKS